LLLVNVESRLFDFHMFAYSMRVKKVALSVKCPECRVI